MAPKVKDASKRSKSPGKGKSGSRKDAGPEKTEEAPTTPSAEAVAAAAALLTEWPPIGSLFVTLHEGQDLAALGTGKAPPVVELKIRYRDEDDLPPDELVTVIEDAGPRRFETPKEGKKNDPNNKWNQNFEMMVFGTSGIFVLSIFDAASSKSGADAEPMGKKLISLKDFVSSLDGKSFIDQEWFEIDPIQPPKAKSKAKKSQASVRLSVSYSPKMDLEEAAKKKAAREASRPPKWTLENSKPPELPPSPVQPSRPMSAFVGGTSETGWYKRDEFNPFFLQPEVYSSHPAFIQWDEPVEKAALKKKENDKKKEDDKPISNTEQSLTMRVQAWSDATAGIGQGHRGACVLTYVEAQLERAQEAIEAGNAALAQELCTEAKKKKLLIPRIPKDELHKLELRMMLIAGDAARTLGISVQVETHADEAVVLAQSLNDEAGLIQALQLQGAALVMKSQPAKALEKIEQALDIATKSNNLPRIVGCYKDLAEMYHLYLRDQGRAMLYFRRYHKGLADVKQAEAHQKSLEDEASRPKSAPPDVMLKNAATTKSEGGAKPPVPPKAAAQKDKPRPATGRG
ncbi:hypothetical protein CYMTET_8489 [Cymbomonas tetramitiformis]|uniref:C2 domain-containing protein n=1 Tax=Cymbomonas tetramitiformis TaxID=36881 RepID=A0AAE0GT10_9CHLO|nr:hypothetical protein CYMTET_8489 [Cymbomonas tetramitiformis]